MLALMVMLQTVMVNVSVSTYIMHRLHCRYVLNLVTDINECANRSTIDCTQQCINTPGSYECDCYDGYRAVTANATKCEGTYM